MFILVPEVGIEPTCPCERGILSPLRLPVSPLRHGRDYIDGVRKVKLKSVDKQLLPVLMGCSINPEFYWGCSSAGRALEWHSRGQEFDPPQLHQKF